LAAVQEAILAWFAENRRDLPWRHTRDPYRILVSEVMLQQIQVSRAIPFYHAFLARFPTLESLATAPLADAIRVWGDLGRYKRVVNLHRTARLILADHGGRVPPDVAVLRSLPGIGPYTAGAVACFAYELDTAFVDTNMRRVLHRLFLGADIPKPTASDAQLLRLAAAAVPTGHGWSWNQGLMEFGALHCTARRPACTGCPVQTRCRAFPAIQTALLTERAVRPASKPAYRYEDSNRFYRGRVLARLRDHSLTAEAAHGVPLDTLGTQIRADFAASDVPWLSTVVASLAKDGLAVAEERRAYDAGTDADAEQVEVRVRLP
jgi:A/G-specific adenine glycosylase